MATDFPVVPDASASAKHFTAMSERQDSEAVPDADKVTYDAYCHCKSVHYTTRIPSLSGASPHNVAVCNCSICVKKAYLLVYPTVPNFNLVQGRELLKFYSFAAKRVRHVSCANCASSLWIEVAPGQGSFDGKEPRVCCNVSICD